MAGTHVTVVSINDPLSFHEKVCEKKKNCQGTDILAKEDYARVSLGAGASFGAPNADRLREIMNVSEIGFIYR